MPRARTGSAAAGDGTAGTQSTHRVGCRPQGMRCFSVHMASNAQRRSWEREMIEESNKASVRRYFDEVWVRGDVAVLDELFVPGSLMVGAAKANVAMMRPAVSDIRATVDDLVAEGDKVAAYVSFTGVNTGPLLGFPPTGKAAVLSALYLFTFENGRIRTMVFETSLFELLMALGLVSPPLASTLPPDGPKPLAI